MVYVIGIGRELRVVGQNGEYADIDNPRGDIVREVYFVTATDTAGHVHHHFHESTDLRSVETLASRIQTHILNHPDWQPITGRWAHMRNVYGSEAYIQEGDEARLAAWERARDDRGT